MKNKSRFFLVLFFIAITSCLIVFLGFIFFVKINQQEFITNSEMAKQDYYDFNKTMMTANFKKVDDQTYISNQNEHPITILLSMEEQKIKKNNYTFSISDKSLKVGDQIFIKKDVLEALTTKKLSYKNKKIIAKDKKITAKNWNDYDRTLIAHAGGALRYTGHNLTYTNGKIALQQNYSLGMRVFEFDFQFTEDGKLAAVHSGMVEERSESTIAMDAKQWQMFNHFGDIGPMLSEDILEQMVINPDMILVPDTKEDGLNKLIQLIQQAKKIDPTLLKRIIPQVYSQDMYNDLTTIYPFTTIFYSTYLNQEPIETVLDFVSKRDSICAVTISASDELRRQAFIQQREEKNLNVSFVLHTVNSFDEYTKVTKEGVDAVMTDFLNPYDFRYEEILKNKQTKL